ncbi:MAG: carboxypeptidase regulatory-like domain-containing protein [Gemmatimonadaceae bacterium]|nr:carboxypeptidase regulatory-like domain-containing protein [Gemmatimonadaceae bacterium]MCW5826915.1 carboxypeptidase regulatory-like domain-containing protein [Gemmatimonadaceae bacterium]
MRTVAQERRWRGLGVIVAFALFGTATPASAQESSVTVTSRGALAGVVRDPQGNPIADARVTIDSPVLQARTDSSGAFALGGLPTRQLRVTIRALGYQPAVAELEVPLGQTLNIAIVLAPTVARLDAISVVGQLMNQVVGTVLDDRDRPVPGVVVDVLGLDRRTETGNDGRFILIDLRPGSYILQFRAPGYRVAQYGVRMIAQIDRDVTIRLRPFDRNDRFPAALAAQVVLEANRRHAMRGARSVIVGRDELERWDTAPLGIALGASQGAIAMRETNLSCILVDGHEPLNAAAARSGFDGLGSRRNAPISIDPGGTSGGSRGGASAGGAGGTGGWLNFFRANEVEMVEIYPEGSENSRSLCSRFPPSSGCACPPEPSGIVVWLKR